MFTFVSRAVLAGFVGSVAAAAVAHAQVFKPAEPVTYTQRYEVFGGINFLNGKAGQNLPKRYNLGGGDVMFTDWLTPKFGVAGDVRYDAGTTPVLPSGQATNPPVQTRPLVSQFIGMGGVQYHWLGNHFAGVNLHALAGASHGTFDHSNPSLPSQTFTVATGLYTNRTSFNGVVGGSVDLNRSARWAVRLSPDLVFEEFGSDLREFFSISGGVVYRFGDR